jgi:hydrogenase maturation protein HypF
VAGGAHTPALASCFHNTLAEMIAGVARQAGQETIVLTGGCFQNRFLSIRAVERLTACGLDVHWHQRVPPNDGGIAPGQVIGAAQAMRAAKSESTQ